MGRVLAAAFADHAWIRWALPLAEEDGEVLAAASWVPAVHPPLPAATRAPLDRTVPDLLGDRREALEAADAATRALWPEDPAWVLAAVGTVPAARGRGLAGALIAEGLREVDAHGAAAVLETSSVQNVRLYRRHGFEVPAEADPPGDAPHVWVMVRPGTVS